MKAQRPFIENHLVDTPIVRNNFWFMTQSFGKTVDDTIRLFLYWVFVEQMSVGQMVFDQNKENQNEGHNIICLFRLTVALSSGGEKSLF
jgi:hypothetical protein